MNPRSLLGSIGLHLLLIAAGLFLSRANRPRDLPILIETPSHSAAMRIADARSPRTSRPPKTRTRSQTAPPPRKISLRDLGIFSGAPADYLAKPFRGPPSPQADQTGTQTPYGFEDQLTSTASPILGYLFHRIDGGIAYPSELRDAGIDGEVSATLRFDDQGHWIDAPADVKEGNLGSRYFRIYLIHRLRALLADPIPENLWKTQPHSLTVDARFVFARVAPETVDGAQVGPQYASGADPTRFSQVDMDGGQRVEARLGEGKQGQYGRKLFFYRAHLVSPFDWKLGPLAGYGLLPTVGVDPFWFVDKVDDLIHHRAKIDPLEHYRDDPEW